MYSTIDYFCDGNWLIDKLYAFYKRLSPSLTILILKRKLLIYSVDYKRIFRRVKRNLPYGFIIIYLGMMSVSLITIVSEKSQGLRVITLTSGSMEPVIPVPSVVFTRPSTNYQVGDIITYKEVSAKTNLSFKRTITHRIIEEKNNSGNKIFITQGDANKVPDTQVVKKDEILGKVVLILPYLGYFPLLIKTIPGFLVLIVVPAYLLIKNELKYLAKESGYWPGVV